MLEALFSFFSLHTAQRISKEKVHVSEHTTFHLFGIRFSQLPKLCVVNTSYDLHWIEVKMKYWRYHQSLHELIEPQSPTTPPLWDLQDVKSEGFWWQISWDRNVKLECRCNCCQTRCTTPWILGYLTNFSLKSSVKSLKRHILHCSTFAFGAVHPRVLCTEKQKIQGWVSERVLCTSET